MQGDKVKVINSTVQFNGKTGTIDAYFPKGLISSNYTLYRIKYTEGNSGMFPEHELELI